VGSRSASEVGLRVASTIGSELVRRSVTVVSGLAAGIDTAVHEATLSAGGRTVAVIGTGIQQFYPRANQALQRRIGEHGLVLSQFWPEAPPAKHQFPMRNAVMSGYCAATVVVEAGEHSGARIQARLALQHGRQVILRADLLALPWAKSLTDRPGVHVVRGADELLGVVDAVLSQREMQMSSKEGLAGILG
jgi:DNA processing protein